MFLHIKAIDRQISHHLKDGKPLKDSIRFALDFWKKTETNIVAHVNRRVLDLEKTAGDNRLTGDELITVDKKEDFDAETKRLEEDKGKEVTTV